MSSFVRTLQKRMLKKMGYHRQKVSVSEVAGVAMSRRLKKGEGPILKPDGEPVTIEVDGVRIKSRRWPLSRPVLDTQTS